MATHRHLLFLMLFATSCLNKETTLFMTVAYASYFYDRLPRRQFFGYVGGQLLVFALVYVTLRYRFAGNAGSTMEFWWLSQVDWFTKRSFSDCATFLVFVNLIVLDSMRKPIVVRRAATMLIPNIGFFLIGGWAGEMRNFYESVPLLSLIACRNLEFMILAETKN